MEEIWKDIPDYEGLYQVSNYGIVRSLPKQWFCGFGAIRKHNGKIMKLQKRKDGYITVRLTRNEIAKTITVHKLVASAFLNHKPNGYKLVVDHVNDNPSDNRVENLQLVTQRFNVRKTQGKYSSQYKGVSWCKIRNKFVSQIKVHKKKVFLGRYENEYDAHLAYQNALQNLEQ